MSPSSLRFASAGVKVADERVAVVPKSLPISQSIFQSPVSVQDDVPVTLGVCALAGAAKTATPARPTRVPAATARVRRNLDLSRFTPTPGLGSGVRRGSGGPTPERGRWAVDDASPRRRHAAVTTCNR